MLELSHPPVELVLAFGVWRQRGACLLAPHPSCCDGAAQEAGDAAP